MGGRPGGGHPAPPPRYSQRPGSPAPRLASPPAGLKLPGPGWCKQPPHMLGPFLRIGSAAPFKYTPPPPGPGPGDAGAARPPSAGSRQPGGAASLPPSSLPRSLSPPSGPAPAGRGRKAPRPPPGLPAAPAAPLFAQAPGPGERGETPGAAAGSAHAISRGLLSSV